MVNLHLNCMPLRMTDSGFDSGPPSKKSKTSSPTSSITSFDPDNADLGLILTELSNVLSPELSDSISRLQSLDGLRKPDETIQNNQHLSALLGMNMPLVRGQMNSELQFLMNTPGLPASGMPSSRLPGSLQQQQQPGTTVSWPQPMNYPPHRYPVLNQTGLEASPQVEMLTPVEFAPGLNGSFVNGQGFGAGFVRGTINPPARMTYSVPTRIRMTSANESRLIHGQKVRGTPLPGIRAEFSDGDRSADNQFLNGTYPVHSGELSTKQFGCGPTISVSPHYPPPPMNTRIGGISDTNTLAAPALDISRPVMSGVPCRTPLNVAVAETVPRSSAPAARLPSDIRTNVQHSSTEKQRLIQQQLVLIFHAYKCHRREQANGVQHPPCPLPKCQSMKNVLRHMTSCTEGRLCRVPHCSSSSQIIGHWRNCTRPDCPICAPLKNGSLRRPPGVPSTVGPTPGAVAPADANPTYKGFSPKHATAVQPPPKASDSNPTTTQTSLAASDTIGANFLRSLQSSLGGGVEDVAPVVPGQDWRMSVTQDLRNHLVHKLVQAIFPAHGSMALKDPRMSNLVCYAKKVEGDMYEKARSRENYYHLLAEKIYKIQKELEQKKLRKILDQNGVKSAARMPVNNDPSVASQGNFQRLLPSSLIMSGETSSRPSPSPVLLSPVSAAGASSFVDFAGLGASPTFSQPTVGDLLSQDQGNSMANTAAPSASMIQCRDRSRLTPFFTDAPRTNAGQVDVIAQNSFAVHHTDSKLQLASVLSKRCQEMDMLEKRQIQNEFSSLSSQAVSSFPETFPGAPAAMVSIGNNPCQLWEKSDKLELNIKQEMTFEPFFSPDNGMLSSELDSVSQSMGSHLSDGLFGYDPMPSSLTAEVKLDIKHEDITDDEMATKSEPAEIRETFDASCGVLKKETELKTESEKDDCQKKTGIKTEIEVKMENEMESTKEEKTDKGLECSGQMSSAEPVKEPTENGQTSSPKHSLKAGKKAWTSEELKQTFLPIIEKLSSIEPEAIPFRCPVDPMALGIPDYFQIVKRPMDLSTIRSKLESGEYVGPWNAVDDVLLMFDNAWLYNRKTSKVYKYCSKLAEVFESEVDPVMRSLGFCCGRRYVFTPQVLCCFGKQLCVIPRDSTYYNYLDRYIYCEKCFNELHGSEIEIHDDPSNPGLKIKKESFVREKNDKLDPEPMIDCLECGRRMHKICVLHLDQIWTTGFICSPCRQAIDQKRKENKYTAKRLPPTKLGSYLENRVNSLLKRKAAGAGDVAVRVLSSYDKVVEVKPAMKAKFVDNGMMSESFPYRVKSIFAFEEIDGTDVCFFGMHVQEYGSDCPPSNARRVYIAYLDSVNFFQPRHFRTIVYHELLIGYLDYVKSLGFQMAHIWACPPSEGDDYIFYCHPPEMKIPKPKRLQEWYRKMLDKAICENVIFDYKDILKEFKDSKMKEVAELPYFEGDFWPNVFEENIKELNQELEKRQKEEEEATNDTDDGETNDGNSTELHSVAGKKKDQKSGQTKKKSSKTKKLSSRRSRMSDDLTERVLLSMEKHKEVFFVIRLQSTQPDDEMASIKDPDPLMNNELLDGRDPFLTMSREKHLEFSSLRRAKFSTATLLYELHLQAKDNFIYTCNSCKASVETRYHCSVCEDFDLCVLCFRKTQHPHRMTKLGLDLDDDGSQVDAKPQNAQEARRLKMQSCVQVLEHSCICRDANCTLASCRNMRKALAFHPKECQRKTRSACAKCKQLFMLCCYHAKSCREKRCLVPFCQNIKTNLEKKRQNERFQQQRLIMRRTAMMNCVEDATVNDSAMPVLLGPPGPGYAGFTNDTNKEMVPLLPGTEVLFHPNVQPFGCTVGNDMYAPLSQRPPTSPYDFMSSAQTYSPMGSSGSIGYSSLPGTSGIGHFGQPEMYGQPQGPQMKLDSVAAAADRTKPALMVNQMLPEKFMGLPSDKQRLIRVLKGNPRLMAEFIKKVRLQEALKQQQQQQQLMMPPGPGTAQALSDGSVRYPMVPYPGQPIQQPGGMMGAASGRTMMATNGDHHLLQPHQSMRLSPQRMPMKFDRHHQPGMTPCSQPYPGINQECVGQLPFHQMAPHVNPQLMNHSAAQQPQGSTMSLGSYLLPPDKMPGPPPPQQMTDCSSVALSSVGSLASSSSSSSSPCPPANNSLSPHHLPTHYKNQVLPHSTDFGAVQRMGPQQNALCQDAMFARQLSFSPNAKTPDMVNAALSSRQTELTGSLQQQQQQQFSSTNSYLHFMDRK